MTEEAGTTYVAGYGMLAEEPGFARVQHAISLLVHEQLPVIIDQCINFETFAPHSVIMIHVSASGSVSQTEVREALEKADCRRCFVNDVSHASDWGSIINGHFANIWALQPILDSSAYVSLHASNDMLLSELPVFGSGAQSRYEMRSVSASSLWHTGRCFAQSEALPVLLQALGCKRAIGSQIEGSTYPFEALLALATAIEPHGAILAALPRIAEEIIFPTWALEWIGPPADTPYVLFRPTILPALGISLMPDSLRSSALSNVVHRALNRIEMKVVQPNARLADVEAIMAGKRVAVAAWAQAAPPRPPQIFHGIKRIERKIDDPLRQRIAVYTAAHRAAHASTPDQEIFAS